LAKIKSHVIFVRKLYQRGKIPLRWKNFFSISPVRERERERERERVQTFPTQNLSSKGGCCSVI